ncbi:MAG: glutamate racemase [Flavobacteriales bacterium]|nr:glutamate racemase [Flavobacteriales bacterium]
MVARAPIGIFDSGVGGLTVAAVIKQALPSERLLYFGDAAHIPYGDRSLREVRAFSAAIVRALLAKGCKLIVIACNTASAAALRHVREAYPMVVFVGMEPAVKPAAERSRSHVVGVIATQATFQGELFESVLERFAQGTRVIERPCPGLVQAIEAGELDSPGTERMLRRWLEPMLAEGMDELVLACTHYPLVRPLIERICGPEVEVIDPAPAVARQVMRLLHERGLAASEGNGSFQSFTSGEPAQMVPVLRLLGLPDDGIARALWENGVLTLP